MIASATEARISTTMTRLVSVSLPSSRAEAELFDDLRALCDGRAVVLISHRLAGVRAADRIYVMRDGAVTEQGRHGELLAARL